jgi:hypothetical protein
MDDEQTETALPVGPESPVTRIQCNVDARDQQSGLPTNARAMSGETKKARRASSSD